MTRFLPILLILLIIINACECNPEKEREYLSNPFFGLIPTDSVQILAPEIISTDQFEYNGTFSPNGTEFYYSINLPNRAQIVFLELVNDIWSEPKFAAFSSEFSDVDPLFSPDGARLYFTSNRPISNSTAGSKNNIWFVEKTENGWGKPKFVALTENENFYSSITTHGDIYFNTGNGDIFKATKTDSSHLIEKLPDLINLNKSVSDPFISPNEDYLIFRGNNLVNRVGITDLFISFNIDNEWTEPLNLGEPINSSAREICPYITTNGEFFIFTSNRLIEEFETSPLQPINSFIDKSKSFDNGRWNIFYTSTKFIDKLREKAEFDRSNISTNTK